MYNRLLVCTMSDICLIYAFSLKRPSLLCFIMKRIFGERDCIIQKIHMLYAGFWSNTD